jgi:hypothetical protein
VEVVQEIYAHIQEAAPDENAVLDPSYQAGLLASVAAVMAYCLDAMKTGVPCLEPVPALALEQVQRAAHAEISLALVVRRYIAGHSRLGEIVATQAEQLGLLNDGLAMQHLRKVQETLLERLVAAVVAEYQRERDRISPRSQLRSRDERRAEIVHQLLGGATSATYDPVELDYELEAWHIGLIVAGVGAGRTVRRLAERVGCEVLPIACGGQTVWAWLGAQRRLGLAEVESVILIEKEGTGPLVAFGEQMLGLEGWRLTHREARAALEVARCRPQRVTHYRDVALEAAALQDDALANVLIDRCLSPLDGGDNAGTMRRRLLRVLFAAEHNKSSAAQALGVDRDTVHRHVKEIERRLGCRIHECQAEIDIALRIEELQEKRGDAESPSGIERHREGASRTSPRWSAARPARRPEPERRDVH